MKLTGLAALAMMAASVTVPSVADAQRHYDRSGEYNQRDRGAYRNAHGQSGRYGNHNTRVRRNLPQSAYPWHCNDYKLRHHIRCHD
ncbi:hypothetical protein NHF48_002270 [Sphingomonas sp. H160509]|jgi:hypothetical protein|uniref:hypothetical protein n=1 Tax=unclassified Sphingomonas TaxID=196159 RepID=UPI0007146D7D|nr:MULTISPECIES: hypothetical protein [unclassified Sphingomonas]KQM56687.1 hypothetical protein ASE69_03475 [Sphingomonas sp. Leaf208]MDD1450042.1 hypothetical protein [Sphingomonas sp. H160509]